MSVRNSAHRRQPLARARRMLLAAFALASVYANVASAAEANAPGAASGVPAASYRDLPLPPALPWSGDSERLLDNVPQDWLTPIEISAFERTPTAAETLEFLRKLDKASPYIQLHEIGRSGDNRPIWLVVASTNTEKDLAKRKRGDKARVLVQAGIHSGEIDGKDAGLMLLRDIVRGKAVDLLKHSDLYFIPIFNIDGHERRGAVGRNSNMRVNQRGPDNMGWRATARNLNLNRDYMKADAAEMQALLKLVNQIDPELYLDVHVTDGIDYVYDITYGFNDKSPHSPAIAGWLDGTFRSAADRALTLAGHDPGDLVFAIDNRDVSKGLSHWNSEPRFSNGYGDLRHMPSILVENHSLKPYRQRVLGTYVLIANALRIAGDQRATLKQAIASDRARRPVELPVNFVADDSHRGQREFAGVKYELFDSPVSGNKEVRWLGEEQAMTLPVVAGKPSLMLPRPKAYWLPAHRRDVIERLKLHGVQMEELRSDTVRELTFYRLPQAKVRKAANEGRVGADAGTPQEEIQQRLFTAGSVRISTDQPLGNLVIALLEPQANDSFFAWGFFHEIFQRTEYIEGYVVEPLAQQMLARDPALKAEFEAALKDEKFAADPDARLEWFYQRSGYADQDHRLYPVGIER